MLDQQTARFEIGSEELVRPSTIVTDVSDSFGFDSPVSYTHLTLPTKA